MLHLADQSDTCFFDRNSKGFPVTKTEPNGTRLKINACLEKLLQNTVRRIRTGHVRHFYSLPAACGLKHWGGSMQCGVTVDTFAGTSHSSKNG